MNIKSKGKLCLVPLRFDLKADKTLEVLKIVMISLNFTNLVALNSLPLLKLG